VEVLERPLRRCSATSFSFKLGQERFLSALVFSFLVFFLATPPKLLAIHAIIKNKDALPRKHGPLHLGMDLVHFLKSAGGILEKPAIGQFEHESRYRLDPLLFSDHPESILADFYAGTLFRIEINHKPLKKEADFQDLIKAWSKRYGNPRKNRLPRVRLYFWDDGATRMILEIDKEEGLDRYSLTYIDDDLFHKASRDRVQRETAGASSYGK